MEFTYSERVEDLRGRLLAFMDSYVYPAEAEQRRLSVMQSYATPATQIDVDYMPDVSGFNPWGGQDKPDHGNPDRRSQLLA